MTILGAPYSGVRLRPFVAGVFRLAQCPRGSSVVQQVAGSASVLKAPDVPLCV